MSVNGGRRGGTTALELSPNSDRQHADLAADDGEVAVLIRVPRLLWASVEAHAAALHYGTEILVARTDAVLSGEVAALGDQDGRARRAPRAASPCERKARAVERQGQDRSW